MQTAANRVLITAFCIQNGRGAAPVMDDRARACGDYCWKGQLGSAEHLVGHAEGEARAGLQHVRERGAGERVRELSVAARKLGVGQEAAGQTVRGRVTDFVARSDGAGE
ncbi:MAG: hypothetical protein ACRDQU_19370 [Pseudonocardiaceae bacterium]